MLSLYVFKPLSFFFLKVIASHIYHHTASQPAGAEVVTKRTVLELKTTPSLSIDLSTNQPMISDTYKRGFLKKGHQLRTQGNLQIKRRQTSFSILVTYLQQKKTTEVEGCIGPQDSERGKSKYFSLLSDYAVWKYYLHNWISTRKEK